MTVVIGKVLVTCAKDGRQVSNGEGCEHMYVDFYGHVWQWVADHWNVGDPPPIRKVWPVVERES